MNEQWRRLIYRGQDYGDYYLISNLGNVKSLRTNKTLKLTIGNRGYYHFTLSFRGEGFKIRASIHKALAETFISNPNNYPTVNHIDGNKANNCLDNLEWCTNIYNHRHARNLGLFPEILGEACASSKLTDDEVKYIKRHYKKGDRVYGVRPLARKFNVSHAAVTDIVKGRTWKHIN